MPWISLSLALLMGLCLYAGVHFLLCSRKFCYSPSSDGPYFLFGLMCFLNIGFMAAEFAAYHSVNVESYVTAFKWRLNFALGFLMIWPWFVYRYTANGPRWLTIGLSVYLGGHLLLNLIRPYGIAFDQLPNLTTQLLPWDESVVLHERGPINFFFKTGWLGVFAVIAYTFFAAFRQYFRGQRRQASTLIASMTVFSAFVCANLLVVTGVLHFVFLAEYGFPTLILIMSAAMQREADVQARRTQAIFNHVPAVMYLKNRDGQYLMINRQYESLFQVSNSNVVGKTDYDVFEPEQADAFYTHDRRVLADGRPKEFEESVSHPDGTLRTYRSIKFPLSDGNNEPTILCGISSDITERKQAQQHIAQSEAKYRTLFESASDAILIMQGDHFVDCNSHALSVFGCSRDELLGSTPMQFSPPAQYDGRDSTEVAREKIDAALNGTAQFFPWHHRRLDGALFDAEVSLGVIELDGQHCLQAIVRDVTARKRTEEAIKNIAAGVSSQTGEAFSANLWCIWASCLMPSARSSACSMRKTP